MTAAVTACAPSSDTAAPVMSGSAPAGSATTGTATEPTETPEPRRARTARAVAAQIEAAERAIDDPGTRPADLARAGRAQQLGYRVLATRPDWDRRVRALVPRWVRPLVAANVASRREFRSMHGELSRTLPAWRIVRPAPARELLRHYREAERRFGVDWEFLAAINLVETGMGRIRGTSVAGAQGPMQFMPATWAAYGVGDVRDPRDAVLGAGRYLDAMGYRSGDRVAVDRALYRYNNHPAYVRGVRLLAEVMQQRPRAYLGYHAWEVYYLTARGEVLLPVGYAEQQPVPVATYVATTGRR